MKTKNISPPTAPVATLWDRLGIVGSTLCLIHCAATPLFVGVFSVAGFNFLGGEQFHQIAALLLALVAFFAFMPGFRRHRNGWVFGAGALGVLLLIVGGFAVSSLEGLEVAVTVMGSLLLVTAHMVNWRLTSRMACHAG